MTTPTDLAGFAGQIDTELEEDMTWPRLQNEVLRPAFLQMLVEAGKRVSAEQITAGAKVTISLTVSA